jgi:hypothetical protein
MTRAASAGSPSPAARVALVLLAARAVFGLAYLASDLRPANGLWYLPIERAFTFTATPHGLAMGWYGRTAGALAAALAAGALAWLACLRGPLARVLARPRFVLAAARAVGLMVLVDFGYFGWTLSQASPAPPPLAP